MAQDSGPGSGAVPAGSAATQRLRLTVQAPGGASQRLEFTGMDQAEAVRRAQAQGLRVLAIETPDAVAAAAQAASGPGFALLMFSQELLSLLDAGLNLTEALATLLAKERASASRQVLQQVLAAVREGHSFSDVLSAMPQHFPPVYAATVRASERTGDLPRALARYIAYQQQFEGIRKKLVSAAIYPAMLLLVGGFVTLFLLGYVVPRFSVVYESSGRDMPWLSTALLSLGQALHANGPLALGVLAAGLGVGAWALSRPATRRWLLDTLLRTPWLAQRADDFRLARCYRSLSLLLASGITTTRAMGMVDGLLSPAQRQRLQQARTAVEQGHSLSSALVAAQLAGPVAESLMKVGERSGQMADMLERAAHFHDEDFARWVDWASRVLEPVLMTLIGLVVGTVVVLMYMPIFELAGSLQ
jgi:general secretion pathway protein F